MRTRRVIKEVRPDIYCLFEDGVLVEIDNLPLVLLLRPQGRG